MKRHCHLRFPMVFSSLTQFIWNLETPNFPNRCRLPCRRHRERYRVQMCISTEQRLSRMKAARISRCGSTWTVDLSMKTVSRGPSQRIRTSETAASMRSSRLVRKVENKSEGNVLINGLRTLPSKIYVMFQVGWAWLASDWH